MRILLCLAMILSLAVGCARVSVQAPKEPIKVDISMRLDIYQHIENDIDKIEDMVTGAPAPAPEASQGPQSFLENLIVSEAYADEGLSTQVQQAALRRKERRLQLVFWQEKGMIGENRYGMVEIRVDKDPNIVELVKAENADRKIIYQEIAKKNGSSLEDVQKLYAKRLFADAAIGTPVEVYDESKGVWEWKTKN